MKQIIAVILIASLLNPAYTQVSPSSPSFEELQPGSVDQEVQATFALDVARIDTQFLKKSPRKEGVLIHTMEKAILILEQLSSKGERFSRKLKKPLNTLKSKLKERKAQHLLEKPATKGFIRILENMRHSLERTKDQEQRIRSTGSLSPNILGKTLQLLEKSIITLEQILTLLREDKYQQRSKIYPLAKPSPRQPLVFPPSDLADVELSFKNPSATNEFAEIHFTYGGYVHTIQVGKHPFTAEPKLYPWQTFMAFANKTGVYVIPVGAFRSSMFSGLVPVFRVLAPIEDYNIEDIQVLHQPNFSAVDEAASNSAYELLVEESHLNKSDISSKAHVLLGTLVIQATSKTDGKKKVFTLSRQYVLEVLNKKLTLLLLFAKAVNPSLSDRGELDRLERLGNAYESLSEQILNIPETSEAIQKQRGVFARLLENNFSSSSFDCVFPSGGSISPLDRLSQRENEGITVEELRQKTEAVISYQTWVNQSNGFVKMVFYSESFWRGLSVLSSMPNILKTFSSVAIRVLEGTSAFVTGYMITSIATNRVEENIGALAEMVGEVAVLTMYLGLASTTLLVFYWSVTRIIQEIASLSSAEFRKMESLAAFYSAGGRVLSFFNSPAIPKFLVTKIFGKPHFYKMIARFKARASTMKLALDPRQNSDPEAWEQDFHTQQKTTLNNLEELLKVMTNRGKVTDIQSFTRETLSHLPYEERSQFDLKTPGWRQQLENAAESLASTAEYKEILQEFISLTASDETQNVDKKKLPEYKKNLQEFISLTASDETQNVDKKRLEMLIERLKTLVQKVSSENSLNFIQKLKLKLYFVKHFLFSLAYKQQVVDLKSAHILRENADSDMLTTFSLYIWIAQSGDGSNLGELISNIATGEEIGLEQKEFLGALKLVKTAADQTAIKIAVVWLRLAMEQVHSYLLERLFKKKSLASEEETEKFLKRIRVVQKSFLPPMFRKMKQLHEESKFFEKFLDLSYIYKHSEINYTPEDLVYQNSYETAKKTWSNIFRDLKENQPAYFAEHLATLEKTSSDSLQGQIVVSGVFIALVSLLGLHFDNNLFLGSALNTVGLSLAAAALAIMLKHTIPLGYTYPWTYMGRIARVITTDTEAKHRPIIDAIQTIHGSFVEGTEDWRRGMGEILEVIRENPASKEKIQAYVQENLLNLDLDNKDPSSYEKKDAGLLVQLMTKKSLRPLPNLPNFSIGTALQYGVGAFLTTFLSFVFIYALIFELIPEFQSNAGFPATWGLYAGLLLGATVLLKIQSNLLGNTIQVLQDKPLSIRWLQNFLEKTKKFIKDKHKTKKINNTAKMMLQNILETIIKITKGEHDIEPMNNIIKGVVDILGTPVSELSTIRMLREPVPKQPIESLNTEENRRPAFTSLCSKLHR